MVIRKIINRFNVQGSGIGPTIFIICITDIKPIDSKYYMIKYNDDSSLLILKKHDIALLKELQNVLKWAE